MTLSDSDKERVIDALDALDDQVRKIIIASLDALAEWLMKTLYAIYLKVKPALIELWNWICSIF
ncbi:MAG: hypothetical protein HC880_09145 [Bacteroidia bacterium]|nr:hypothetical protein [Bacteroidia bacterium]